MDLTVFNRKLSKTKLNYKAVMGKMADLAEFATSVQRHRTEVIDHHWCTGVI